MSLDLSQNIIQTSRVVKNLTQEGLTFSVSSPPEWVDGGPQPFLFPLKMGKHFLPLLDPKRTNIEMASRFLFFFCCCSSALIIIK